MPNPENDLILIKGEDKTADVLSYRADPSKTLVFVTFKNGAEYPYKIGNVKAFSNPRTVIPDEDSLVMKNGSPCFGVTSVQYFTYHARINYRNGFSETLQSSLVKIMKSALCDEKSGNCFEYLKQIANEIGIVAEDGHNILSGRYENVRFVRDDSVFASFLCGVMHESTVTERSTAIFPFGFNISQKKAVENALNSKLSIIEGPPGTGKTQTILNIIANAVMRHESVAVVSANNSATANVLEKLKHENVDFLAAYLGNTVNKEAFIKGQTSVIPNVALWRRAQNRLNSDKLTLNERMSLLEEMLEHKNTLSLLTEELESVKKEREHFLISAHGVKNFENIKAISDRCSSKKVLSVISEYEIIFGDASPKGFFKKIAARIKRYGFRRRFKGIRAEDIPDYCYAKYYNIRVSELESAVNDVRNKLNSYDFDFHMKEYSALSMDVFKAFLAEKYQCNQTRKIYEPDDLWKNAPLFINDYPVVLSTAYSLRSSLSPHFAYDYVIIDESSQVDIVTGVLALSCAKRAVIVGDTKQLPNVVTSEIRSLTDEIFSRYDLSEAYRYSNHSLLTSLTELFPEAPHVLLREHYRCRPEIIGFCNNRFYAHFVFR